MKAGVRGGGHGRDNLDDIMELKTTGECGVRPASRERGAVRPEQCRLEVLGAKGRFTRSQWSTHMQRGSRHMPMAYLNQLLSGKRH